MKLIINYDEGIKGYFQNNQIHNFSVSMGFSFIFGYILFSNWYLKKKKRHLNLLPENQQDHQVWPYNTHSDPA